MASELVGVGPVGPAFGEARHKRGWFGAFRYDVVKRTIDALLVILMAPLAFPLIAILALIVRRDGGPAFYRQDRIGKNGRVFKLWKLRTMVLDADRKLEAYLSDNPEARSEWETHQKLRRDPRITKVGHLIRKYSADELPQLLNVLLGQMSLVGPRPFLPSQRELYTGTAYYGLRPGMTGLWQVSDRNGCTFAERAMKDTQYALSMGLSTDLYILILTPLAVFRGTGL
jgi:exopolysaccharide production protein ExoY